MLSFFLEIYSKLCLVALNLEYVVQFETKHVQMLIFKHYNCIPNNWFDLLLNNTD